MALSPFCLGSSPPLRSPLAAQGRLGARCTGCAARRDVCRLLPAGHTDSAGAFDGGGHEMLVGDAPAVCSSTVSVLGVLAILSVIRLRLQQSGDPIPPPGVDGGLAGLRLELVDLPAQAAFAPASTHAVPLPPWLLQAPPSVSQRCLVQHCRTVAICLRHSCSVYYGLLLAPRRRPLFVHPIMVVDEVGFEPQFNRTDAAFSTSGAMFASSGYCLTHFNTNICSCTKGAARQLDPLEPSPSVLAVSWHIVANTVVFALFSTSLPQLCQRRARSAFDPYWARRLHPAGRHGRSGHCFLYGVMILAGSERWIVADSQALPPPPALHPP